MANDFKRSASAYNGRLLALSTQKILASVSTTSPSSQNALRSSWLIEFPAMPDELVLKRSATYFEKSTPFTPDGIHVYTGTAPLHLDFSFRLHHADRVYCKDGPYTLLTVAARLQSLIVPINTAPKDEFTYGVKTGYRVTNNDVHIEASSADVENKNALSGIGAVAPPATCQLELMNTGDNKPGIVCRGYIKDVSVKFIGPYLRGPGNVYNLPTAAEYGFTFVHRPGHSNLYSFQQQSKYGPGLDTNPQAFARTIQNRLYHTRDLVQYATYQGIDDVPSTEGSNNQVSSENASAGSAPAAAVAYNLDSNKPPDTSVYVHYDETTGNVTFSAKPPVSEGIPISTDPNAPIFMPPKVGAGPTSSIGLSRFGRAAPFNPQL